MTKSKAIVCNVLSFLLHLCCNIVWVVLCQDFFQNMEGYIALGINHENGVAMWISVHGEWGKWARGNCHVQAYVSFIQHRNLVRRIFISNDLN